MSAEDASELDAVIAEVTNEVAERLVPPTSGVTTEFVPIPEMLKAVVLSTAIGATVVVLDDDTMITDTVAAALVSFP